MRVATMRVDMMKEMLALTPQNKTKQLPRNNSNAKNLNHSHFSLKNKSVHPDGRRSKKSASANSSVIKKGMYTVQLFLSLADSSACLQCSKNRREITWIFTIGYPGACNHCVIQGYKCTIPLLENEEVIAWSMAEVKVVPRNNIWCQSNVFIEGDSLYRMYYTECCCELFGILVAGVTYWQTGKYYWRLKYSWIPRMLFFFFFF